MTFFAYSTTDILPFQSYSRRRDPSDFDLGPRLMTTACGDQLAFVQLVFWPGMLLITYLIAKHNRFGVKDAFLAAIGIKSFRRTWLINFVGAGTLLGTLGLAVFIVQNCPG